MYDLILQMTSAMPPVLYVTKLFGMLVGWLWVTLAIYLQWNRRYTFPWPFPAAYCLLGVSHILISNRVFIPMILESVFLTLVGYAMLAGVGLLMSMWLLFVFPDRFEYVGADSID